MIKVRWSVPPTLPLVLLLASCTVPVGGYTAIGTDAAGAPVVHVVMCEGRIDAITAYLHETGENDSTVVIAGVDAPSPISGEVQVALGDPGPGWTVSTPLKPLEAGIVYSVYGSSRDNEWSAAHTDFTTASLARLKAGQVLRQRYDEDKDDAVDVVTSIADFRDHACDGAG